MEGDITTSVVLQQNDRDIIAELSEMNGISFSAALRIIIREWARSNSERPTTTGGNGSTHEQV